MVGAPTAAPPVDRMARYQDLLGQERAGTLVGDDLAAFQRLKSAGRFADLDQQLAGQQANPQQANPPLPDFGNIRARPQMQIAPQQGVQDQETFGRPQGALPGEADRPFKQALSERAGYDPNQKADTYQVGKYTMEGLPDRPPNVFAVPGALTGAAVESQGGGRTAGDVTQLGTDLAPLLVAGGAGASRLLSRGGKLASTAESLSEASPRTIQRAVSGGRRLLGEAQPSGVAGHMEDILTRAVEPGTAATRDAAAKTFTHFIGKADKATDPRKAQELLQRGFAALDEAYPGMRYPELDQLRAHANNIAEIGQRIASRAENIRRLGRGGKWLAYATLAQGALNRLRGSPGGPGE